MNVDVNVKMKNTRNGNYKTKPKSTFVKWLMSKPKSHLRRKGPAKRNSVIAGVLAAAVALHLHEHLLEMAPGANEVLLAPVRANVKVALAVEVVPLLCFRGQIGESKGGLLPMSFAFCFGQCVMFHSFIHSLAFTCHSFMNSFMHSLISFNHSLLLLHLLLLVRVLLLLDYSFINSFISSIHTAHSYIHSSSTCMHTDLQAYNTCIHTYDESIHSFIHFIQYMHAYIHNSQKYKYTCKHTYRHADRH